MGKHRMLGYFHFEQRKFKTQISALEKAVINLRRRRKGEEDTRVGDEEDKNERNINIKRGKQYLDGSKNVGGLFLVLFNPGTVLTREVLKRREVVLFPSSSEVEFPARGPDTLEPVDMLHLEL